MKFGQVYLYLINEFLSVVGLDGYIYEFFKHFKKNFCKVYCIFFMVNFLLEKDKSGKPSKHTNPVL